MQSRGSFNGIYPHEYFHFLFIITAYMEGLMGDPALLISAPRSYRPSREREESRTILTWSQTRLPENNSGGLRMPLGSYPPRYTTKDQSKP